MPLFKIIDNKEFKITLVELLQAITANDFSEKMLTNGDIRNLQMMGIYSLMSEQDKEEVSVNENTEYAKVDSVKEVDSVCGTLEQQKEINNEKNNSFVESEKNGMIDFNLYPSNEYNKNQYEEVEQIFSG